MDRKRRRLDTSDGSEARVCVIHSSSSNMEHFVYIKDTPSPSERINRIREIAGMRQSQPVDSSYRMDDVCAKIPTEFANIHGYHRDCYARFTANLKRLDPVTSVQEAAGTSQMIRRGTSKERDSIILKQDCIFCGGEGRKKVKIKGSWTTEGLKSFEFGGGVTVQQEAKKKQDHKLLRRISDTDLFASEAKYHPSCRTHYYDRPDRWRSKDEEERTKQLDLEEAHRMAFDRVCVIINNRVIKNKEIMKLSELCEVYRNCLDETAHANQEYRAYKLKLKLEKHNTYQGIVAFTPIQGRGGSTSFLVFDIRTDIHDAIRKSYILGSGNKIEETANLMRRNIMDNFKEIGESPWPPTVENLNLGHFVLPNLLKKFLNHVFTDKDPSRRVKRLVSSIGQDICRATTEGRWILPKHVFLGMTLRHMFRSADLVKLLNRLGHSENYYFLLEVETALADAVSTTSDFLPLQIIRHPSCPSVFHSDFDNFDVFVNDLSGAGSVHRAHGIMLQDICSLPSEEPGGFRPELPTSTRTRHRSMNSRLQESLEECYMGKRMSPMFEVVDTSVDGGGDAHQNYMMKNMLWILVRMHAAKNQQLFPGWGGYVSLTGSPPVRLTTVEYYPIIPHPITDYKTVQECLRFAEVATDEVGQQYVISTFDLGVCMKAYPIIWNHSMRYERHIIMIGTFHLLCGYMKMVGKKMNGSGLSDVMLEAGISSPGSISGVLSGKNYARGINCHKVMMEALERLMFEQFLDRSGSCGDNPFSDLPEKSKKLLENLMRDPGKTHETNVLQDEHARDFLKRYENFRAEIRRGGLGKTAMLWGSYVDHIWLMLLLIQSVKNNDFTSYAQSLCLMPDIFFSFGGQNYARYLTYFSMFIANIETSHPGARSLLERGAISVARSFIPGNRCAVDKTTEETFMKHSKSKGGCSTGAGLSGIQTNYNAYQRWTRSAKERAKYLQATYSLADMVDDQESGVGAKHKDNRHSEKVKSERQVKRTMDAFNSFQNPFTLSENGRLYNISSGAPATVDVEDDVGRAESAGQNAKEEFITERLKERNKGFFDSISKIKLKTLGDMNRSVRLTTSRNKTIQYKQQGDIALQLLMKSQELPDDKKLDMRLLLTYPLTPVPYSIGTADNFLAKTDKSKALHYLTKDTDDASLHKNPKECLIIEDGNAIFHTLTQIPANFGEIAEKILSYALQKSTVIFSTDMYLDNSIKAVERTRRGCGDKLIVSNPKITRPKDWKLFLSNDDNKTQLINILHKVWSSDSSARLLVGHEVILINAGSAYRLTSDGKQVSCDEIPSLKSTQEETDSRVILYCFYAKEKGYKFVRVRSPDTDIFFILLHYVNELRDLTILFETGKGNSRRCIDVNQFAESRTSSLCSALLGLHAFTGCDSVSSFKGKGKVKAIKLLEKNEEFVKPFFDLGESFTITPETRTGLEEFTCHLYGKPRIRQINEARYILLQTKCGVDLNKKVSFDLSALPPCLNSLNEHINRANYQTAIWKRAHVADPPIPDPLSDNCYGWESIDNVMQPKWTSGDILPVELIDILAEEEEPESESDDNECSLSEDNGEDSTDDED